MIIAVVSMIITTIKTSVSARPMPHRCKQNANAWHKQTNETGINDYDICEGGLCFTAKIESSPGPLVLRPAGAVGSPFGTADGGWWWRTTAVKKHGNSAIIGAHCRASHTLTDFHNYAIGLLDSIRSWANRLLQSSLICLEIAIGCQLSINRFDGMG